MSGYLRDNALRKQLEEKVKLWQKEYPYGEIFVKRLSMETELPTEELLSIPALGPKIPVSQEAVP